MRKIRVICPNNCSNYISVSTLFCLWLPRNLKYIGTQEPSARNLNPDEQQYIVYNIPLQFAAHCTSLLQIALAGVYEPVHV